MCLNTWFDDVVEQHGENHAVYTSQGQSISFQRLSSAADQIAALLRDRGVEKGHTVLSKIDNLAINIAFWIATWRLGASVVAAKSPKPFLDLGIAVDAMLVPEGEEHRQSGSLCIPFSQSTLSSPVTHVGRQDGGGMLCATVNSTRELGVLKVRPDQVLGDAMRYGDLLGRATGPVLITAKLDSMRSFRDVIRAFSDGAAVIGPDMPMAEYWANISRYKVTDLFVTPLVLHRLLHSDQRPADTSFIKRIFVGSGTAQRQLLLEAEAVFGPILELAAGTPETSIYSFTRFDRATYQTGDIGPTVCGITATIVDENGTQQPSGTVGRLRLTVPSAQQCEGYLGGRNAYDATGGAYPGFLASMDGAGNITKQGRTDDRLSFGGVRYFSGKIEATLEKLPSVDRVCALRVFDAAGAEALGLVVKPAAGFVAADLQVQVKRSLSGIGAVFVQVSTDFATTADGAPDREVIAAHWAADDSALNRR